MIRQPKGQPLLIMKDYYKTMYVSFRSECSSCIVYLELYWMEKQTYIPWPVPASHRPPASQALSIKTEICCNIKRVRTIINLPAVAHPPFPRRGGGRWEHQHPSRSHKSIILATFTPKTAWNWKKIAPRESPLDLSQVPNDESVLMQQELFSLHGKIKLTEQACSAPLTKLIISLYQYKDKHAVADLHSKILDTPPSRSKFLHFRAVFSKFWLGDQFSGLAPPLENPGSAADPLEYNVILKGDPSIVLPLLASIPSWTECYQWEQGTTRI